VTSRSEILDGLAESALKKNGKSDRQRLDEITLGGAAKAAAVGGAFYLALRQFKLPPPSKFSRLVSAVEYGKALAKSKNPREQVSAVVGLLNICARVLLAIPELRDLGHRTLKIVQAEKLEDYFEEE
jgi:hypothetical protein